MITGQHAIQPGCAHNYGRQQMAQAKHLLSLNPTVGKDADKRGHEKRDYALHGIKPTDLAAKTDIEEEIAQRCEIRAPHGKFEEIED